MNGVAVTSKTLAKRGSLTFGLDNSSYHLDAPLSVSNRAGRSGAVLHRYLSISTNQLQTANDVLTTEAIAPFQSAKAVQPHEWRVAAYKGDWQSGARIYRDWHSSLKKTE